MVALRVLPELGVNFNPSCSLALKRGARCDKSLCLTQECMGFHLCAIRVLDRTLRSIHCQHCYCHHQSWLHSAQSPPTPTMLAVLGVLIGFKGFIILPILAASTTQVATPLYFAPSASFYSAFIPNEVFFVSKRAWVITHEQGPFFFPLPIQVPVIDRMQALKSLDTWLWYS